MNSGVYKVVGFISLFVMIIFSVITESSGNLVQNGANVCSRTVSFRENYQQSYQASYRHRSTYKCGFWNLKRCSRYRTAYRTHYRTATRTSYRKQYQCCKGWSQVGNQCTKAICTQPCVNGTCTKPDNCSCHSGYYGNLCDRGCPSNKWGPHCKHDCLCQNNAKCSPHTGTCTCTPGWEGQYCNKTCDQGYYGDKCLRRCTCPNGGTCDAINGYCTCAAGYQGQRCESECSSGWYGQDCAVKCACLNGASCDHVNGTCNCTAGWAGDICNQKCPEGTYGYRCAQTCLNCMNGATCDHVTGMCDCRPGYRGERCENICQEGTFGQGCQGICACKNNATCSHINGSCICTPEYTGKHCEHHIEMELLVNNDHEKHTGTSNPLVPSLAAGISVVLILILMMLVYVFYRKKKKPRKHKTTNPEQHIYASADGTRSSSGHEETTEITDAATELNDNQETDLEHTHVYQSPTARPMAVNASDDNVAMETYYMDLRNQSSLESNTYEPLSKVTLKKNQLKAAVYDVPVAKKKINAYEVVKLNQNVSDEGHYYKGLERPSTSRADDVSAVAMETETADRRKDDVKENHYQTPDREFMRRKKVDDEAFGYATPN